MELPKPKPTKDDLEQLKQLYFSRFGVMLTDEQALQLGTRLVNLVYASIRPLRAKVL